MENSVPCLCLIYEACLLFEPFLFQYNITWLTTSLRSHDIVACEENINHPISGVYLITEPFALHQIALLLRVRQFFSRRKRQAVKAYPIIFANLDRLEERGVISVEITSSSVYIVRITDHANRFRSKSFNFDLSWASPLWLFNDSPTLRSVDYSDGDYQIRRQCKI